MSTNFLKNTFEKFFGRLAEYSNPKIEVNSQEKVSEKYTMVSSILIATDERSEVKIDWRIYTKNPEKPLIRDLIIEGLSLARTQKEEFNLLFKVMMENRSFIFSFRILLISKFVAR